MPDAPALPSYASGISDTPLLGDMIGENFDRTVAAFPDQDALVDRYASRRWTNRDLATEVNRPSRVDLASTGRRRQGGAGHTP